MKKLIPFLLTGLLLYNSIGFIVLHVYHVAKTRSNILKSINDQSYEQDLSILIFSKEDLIKGTAGIERLDAREFRYNGEMYDIVKEVTREDSVYFYCILDERENFLNDFFNTYLIRNHDKNSSNRLPLNIVIRFLSDFDLLKDWVAFQNKFDTTNYIDYSDDLPLYFYPDIPTPPPQKLFLS